MAPTHTPISSLLSPLLQTFRHLTRSTLPKAPSTATTLRTLTTTSSMAAKGGKGGKGGKGKGTVADQRLALIRYHMQHPLTPRPLRLSRMRALRHWTIHRAWMLWRRGKIESEKLELQRMYQSMENACEELRNLDPPGTKDAGRLYRIAMEKKGVFGHGGVPIEYARFQVDTPAKEAWNHGWTR